MQNRLLPLFILIIAVSNSVVAETDCQNENSATPSAECETLLAIYHSTNGENWSNNYGWNIENDPCKFSLVKCNNNGNITGLNLQNNRLIGSLPDLSALVKLEELNLYGNKITGILPDLNSLVELKILNLKINKFSGAIPDLTNLTKLEKILLYNNEFCGQIPELATLTNLTQIDLTQNELSGAIPSLDKLTSLSAIFLTMNLGLCQNLHNDYTGFERWTNNFPLCDEDIAYPNCSQKTLTVNKEGAGKVIGTGIDCGIDCSESYDENKIIVLTAEPTEDSTFNGWSGACTGIENCEITLNQNHTVTANFGIPIKTLTINKNGAGIGAISIDNFSCETICKIEYPKNTKITLIATPVTGSSFTSWQGACADIAVTEPCEIILDQDSTVTGIFEPSLVTLTVNKIGDGNGTVSGNNLDCGNTCATEYLENTKITLIAIPTINSKFIGWQGACSSNEACTVSMNKDQFITANFGVKLPTIIPNPPVVSVEPEIITPEVTIYNSDIEFVGLKESYNVGELLVLDLVEHLQVVPHFERVDLWVAIIAPTGDFYYMTNQPLQPFSSKPHPYRLNIISSQLMLNETRYHLLYFDVPVTANGTYKFYAVYNQAGADIDNLIFTQQSTLAYATTILQNNINPSIISTIPNILTMLVGEKLELMVDSNSSFNALLSACKISSTNIVQSQSGISSSGSGISCYLTALMAGEAILTTINKNGNSIETQIIVP